MARDLNRLKNILIMTRGNQLFYVFVRYLADGHKRLFKVDEVLKLMRSPLSMRSSACLFQWLGFLIVHQYFYMAVEPQKNDFFPEVICCCPTLYSITREFAGRSMQDGPKER